MSLIFPTLTSHLGPYTAGIKKEREKWDFNLILRLGETWKVIEGMGPGQEQRFDNSLPSEGRSQVVNLKSVCSDPQTPAWLVLACISCLPVPPPCGLRDVMGSGESSEQAGEREIQQRVLSSPVQSGAIMRDAFFRTTADLGISLFHCIVLGNPWMPVEMLLTGLMTGKRETMKCWKLLERSLSPELPWDCVTWGILAAAWQPVNPRMESDVLLRVY